MKLDKAMLQQIRVEMNKALAEIAKRNGLESLSCGKCSYTPSSFIMKVEGLMLGGKSAEAQRYEQAISMGFDWPRLGTKFSNRGSEYEIIGCNSSASKIIVVETRSQGQFLFKSDDVKLLCAKVRKLLPGRGALK